MTIEKLKKHGVGHLVNTDVCNAIQCARLAQDSLNEGRTDEANEWINKAVKSMESVSITAVEIDKMIKNDL